MPSDEPLASLIDAGEGVLGDAYFSHRVDVDLAAALELAAKMRGRGDSGEQALASYLEARVAGLGGSYARASSLADEAIPRLDAGRADTLRAMKAYWDVMRYAQSDGLMHYDEDLQRILPSGPLLGRAETSTLEVHRLKQQTAALLNLATVSAILVMAPQPMPFFGQVTQQAFAELTRAFCGGDEICAEAALVAVRLHARQNGSDAGHDLGVECAETLARGGFWAMAALAWLRAGDAALDPISSPFELGLRPLNTMSSTMAMNAGIVVEEFQPAPAAAIEKARVAYDRAREAQTRQPSSRVAAHLSFREGLLAWRGGDLAAALPPMRAAAEQFTAAHDHRTAFRASVALGIVTELTLKDDAPPAAPPGGSGGRTAAPPADYGARLGAVRHLSKAAAYALHQRSNVTASYRLRERAVRLARELPAPQLLSAQLADQASLLTSLGQQRSGLLLLEEAVELHQPYLDAIPGIALYADADKRKQALQVARQVQYSQVVDLVRIALSLEDPRLARTYNERIRALEAEGVLTQIGPLAGSNQVNIEIHDGEFERALTLARQHEDPIQEALALILLERDAEAVAILEKRVTHLLEELAPLARRGTPAESLAYQHGRNQVEQALSMLLRAREFQSAERLVARADHLLGEGRLFVDSAKPWEDEHFKAQLAAGLGDREQALANYEAAMVQVRERAEQVGASHSAVRFDSEVAYLANDYVQYLLLEHDAKRGLRELERFRARDFQEALIASAQLSPASRDLLYRWQRDEAAIQISLRAAAAGEALAPDLLERQRLAARDSRRRLLSALGSSSEEEIDLEAVQARLADDRAVALVYHLYGDRSSVTVLRPGEDPAVRRLEIAGHELRRLVGRMETDMLTADLAWRGTARKLYTELIEPAEDLLPEAEGERKPLLGIVAFGDAHRVPFEALVKEGEPLVSRFDLFQAPSLLSYSRRHVFERDSLVSGVKAIGFNGDLLRHAEAEARMLEAAAPIGAAATRAAFVDLLDDGAPVHVAVHAEPGADNPYFTLLKLADGDLYLHELRGRAMAAPLVVLGACDTASAERSRSDQAVNFATTFIENGVGAIIVTRWAIDDELTVPLVRDFYDRLAGGAQPARALGSAQRRALEGGGGRAHPSFWAAFHLIGAP